MIVNLELVLYHYSHNQVHSEHHAHPLWVGLFKVWVWRETQICLDLLQDAEEQAFKPFVITLAKRKCNQINLQ